MHTWSENPKKDMMNHLELLTYKENCKKLLTGKIKSNRKIKEITSPELEKSSLEMAFCIKQGIEFFNNADLADITISPLLIYYGMLSFAKALIIANSQKYISLDDIKYHGLTTRSKSSEQEQQKTNKMSWKLLNEFANTNDGVFLELCKVFQIDFKKNCTFELKETLKCIPELKNVLMKLKIIDSKVLDCYSELAESNNKTSFAIYASEEDILKSNFDNLDKDYLKSNMHSESFLKYESIKEISIDKFDKMYGYESTFGGRYFVLQTEYIENDKKKKVLLNQILLDYINFFILSEQVRYHQDNWNKILNGDNDAFISILKIYVETVKRRFPNLILNELFNEKFSYGSPAYLS